jgi:hypothetical protein
MTTNKIMRIEPAMMRGRYVIFLESLLAMMYPPLIPNGDMDKCGLCLTAIL